MSFVEADIGWECEEDTGELHVAFVAAEFVGQLLMHNHRGVIDCGDRFVIYGNDAYENDERSRHEVEIVMERLAEHNPVLGVDEEGCSWAVVVRDHGRSKFNAEELDKMVWNAWMVACDEALAAKLKI